MDRTRMAIFWGVALTTLASAAPSLSHFPSQPKSGDKVRIEVATKNAEDSSQWQLEIQAVTPGDYIPLSDRRYTNSWTPVPFQEAAPAPPRLRVAVVPPEFQKHRHLVRYRLVDRATRKTLAPATASMPNEAYYVYDGIPAWQGAVEPGESPIQTFPTQVMRSVQAYQFIARHKDIVTVTWNPRHAGWGDPDRNAYHHTGTMVVDGRVYDHVEFRARGGQWRHSMGKNMWKFRFPKANQLAVSDDFGVPYPARWKILNLGACIQQGNYGHRGEQGMFESAAFRLFNLAGSPAPLTHFVHLRIVSEKDEAPKDQYRGDFWGLYLAVENLDGDFLKDHNLPKDSLFKVEGGQPSFGYEVEGGTTEAEARAFAQRVRSPSAARSVDVPSYCRYRTIVDAVHHYDISFGKNYFFYRHPVAKKWRQVAWDVDLSWDDRMYGGSEDAFSAILHDPTVRTTLNNTIREIRDLLFNPDETGALLDELALQIANPAHGATTFAAADRVKWDYHPIHSKVENSSPGLFYKAARNGEFSGMVQKMKAYVKKRAAYLDRLSASTPTPETPKLELVSQFNDGSVSAKLVSVPGTGSPEWHLGDVTPGGVPMTLAPQGTKMRRHYEIETVWSTNGVTTVTVPGNLIDAHHSYRLRARWKDSAGNAGHFSEPIPLTGSKKP